MAYKNPEDHKANKKLNIERRKEKLKSQGLKQNASITWKQLCNKCNEITIWKKYLKYTGNGSCSRCNILKARQRRYKLKSELILEAGGACVDCGYNENHCALHFHHLDPKDKNFEISKMWQLNIELLRKEASKCILLCANCHAVREYYKLAVDSYFKHKI